MQQTPTALVNKVSGCHLASAAALQSDSMASVRISVVVLLLLSVYMLSCGAKRAPEHLTVIAPRNYSGKISIIACDRTAAADHIRLNPAGDGYTSTCVNSDELTLTVIQGTKATDIPARLTTTGDGIVVKVEAEIR